jgi:hypothetical protein
MLEVRFPVPPVCTAYWGEAEWANWIDRHGVEVDPEPPTLEFLGETWAKTDETNSRGEALYRRQSDLEV